MATSLIPTLPLLSFTDDTGKPAVGYKLTTYGAGTTTLMDTWQDQAGTILNTNPIILDARGECLVWLAQGQEYRFVLSRPDNTVVWTLEDVAGSQSSAVVVPPIFDNIAGHSGPIIAKGATAVWLDGAMAIRNCLINGSFNINQRGVTGTVTLTAGDYGHDRWRAGAGGCTYTFSTTSGLTTINITAGTLQQVIEGANVPQGYGAVCLSWTGTAQGRIASGTYGASGLTGNATGGSDLVVEFKSPGTLTKVQLEQGASPTPFERRAIGLELMMCQRYFEVGKVGISAYQGVSAAIRYGVDFKVTKRAVPTTLTKTNNVINNGNDAGTTYTVNGFIHQVNAVAAGTVNVAYDWTVETEI